MRLRDDRYLVGSGNAGFDLSAPLDCHVDLLDGGDDLARTVHKPHPQRCRGRCRARAATLG
jgi:hypothetical protein